MYKVTDQIVNYRLSDNENVLFNTATEEIIVINDCAQHVWELLKKESSLKNISDSIISKYNIVDNNKNIEEDVLCFIEDLLTKKFLIKI